MFELSCASLNYAWGKVGQDSEVAKLLQSADPSFQLDDTQPYAEVRGNHNVQQILILKITKFGKKEIEL